MATTELQITAPRPYFAEIPYYLWGRMDYDSAGNCRHPRDREWTWLYLTHRDTDERIHITSEGPRWSVSGPALSVARACRFLTHRSSAITDGQQSPLDCGADWNHDAGIERAAAVASQFDLPVLEPFGRDHAFWGSWKWIGWYATEFTWVGRLIMDSLVRDDPRAVALCIGWLEAPPAVASQAEALMHALRHHTGLEFDSPGKWIRWYHSGGIRQFPARRQEMVCRAEAALRRMKH